MMPRCASSRGRTPRPASNGTRAPAVRYPVRVAGNSARPLGEEKVLDAMAPPLAGFIIASMGTQRRPLRKHFQARPWARVPAPLIGELLLCAPPVCGSAPPAQPPAWDGSFLGRVE